MKMKSIHCVPARRLICLTLAGLVLIGAAAATNLAAEVADHPTSAAHPPALPSFQFFGIVLQADGLKYRPHDDVIYPAVLRMDRHIAKPPGKFYMYYAPHDAPGGICVALANKPEGPWREYTNNPVIGCDWAPHYRVSHVSGPDAIWNDKEGKVFLYFHGENDVTRLASSADGIHFDYEGAVVTTQMFETNVTEASYARVFQHTLPGKDNRYVMLLMGNKQNTRRIYLAWSKDGRQWETRRAPLFDPPPGTDQVSGAIYFSWGGRDYFIFHSHNSNIKFNEGFDLYLAETDAAFEHVSQLGKFMDHNFVSPTNPAVMSPTILEEDGRLYLYFNVGPRLQNKIALAIATPKGRKGAAR